MGQATQSQHENYQVSTYGMESYTIHDGKIIVIVQTDSMKREAIDEAVKVLVNAVNTYPEAGVAYVLYDFSKIRGVSPYMSESNSKLMKQFDEDRHVYIGAVGGTSMISTLVRLIVNKVSRFVSNRVHITIFNNYEAATQWLLKMRQNHK